MIRRAGGETGDARLGGGKGGVYAGGAAQNGRGGGGPISDGSQQPAGRGLEEHAEQERDAKQGAAAAMGGGIRQALI
jgi:hypothetical protein